MSKTISYQEVITLLGHPVIDPIVTEEQYEQIKKLAEAKAEEFKREFIIDEMKYLSEMFREEISFPGQ